MGGSPPPCQPLEPSGLLINQPLDSGTIWSNNGISSHTTRPMTLSPASDLKTQQIVWVRNGIVKTSVEWAALGRTGRL